MKISRVALAVPVVLLVAACGAAGNDSASSVEPASPGAAAGSPLPPDTAYSSTLEDGADVRSSTAGAADTAGAPQTAAVISKGQISLHARDLDKARFDLQKILDTLDGTVANENTTADKDGRTDQARLELRVPSKNFDAAMTALPGLGTLVSRTRTSEDVTTQVIDTDARVRSQKLSLARVQALLAKAKDLNQVIAIEEQLSQRQADLDSLEAQQKYLADQTSLATINLYLSVADEPAGAKKEHHTFLTGLHAGWKHLGAGTSAVLTGLGAVLPFALVLGLLGLPALVLWRRRGPKSAPVEV